ncbi:hypothetical protein MASR2M39_14580 [Ignavibacteriales bacterium]
MDVKEYFMKYITICYGNTDWEYFAEDCWAEFNATIQYQKRFIYIQRQKEK